MYEARYWVQSIINQILLAWIFLAPTTVLFRYVIRYSVTKQLKGQYFFQLHGIHKCNQAWNAICDFNEKILIHTLQECDLVAAIIYGRRFVI